MNKRSAETDQPEPKVDVEQTPLEPRKRVEPAVIEYKEWIGVQRGCGCIKTDACFEHLLPSVVCAEHQPAADSAEKAEYHGKLVRHARYCNKLESTPNYNAEIVEIWTEARTAVPVVAFDRQSMPTSALISASPCGCVATRYTGTIPICYIGEHQTSGKCKYCSKVFRKFQHHKRCAQLEKLSLPNSRHSEECANCVIYYVDATLFLGTENSSDFHYKYVPAVKWCEKHRALIKLPL